MSTTAAPFALLPARVRTRWRRDQVVAGLLASSAVACVGAALLLAVDLSFGLGPAARSVLRWLPPVLAMAPLVAAWRRARVLDDARRAALLLEEREPELDHLLTTVLEADASTAVGAALRRRASARLARVHIEEAVPYTFGRLVPWAVAAAAVVAALMTVGSGGAAAVWARWAHPEATEATGATARPADASGTGGRAATGASPALTSVTVTVTPPAYSGLPPREASADVLLGAYPGSRIDVRVGATGGGLVARRAGGAPLAVASAPGGGWRLGWLLEPVDRGLDLTLLEDAVAEGGAGAGGDLAVVDRRVVPIAVLEDRPPEVSLEVPARDLVVATASGTVELRARVTDDFGVDDWEVHWVRSSGSGESFSFDEGRWAWDEVSARGDTLFGALTLDLATTGLGPGDVLHLRAEARDRNDVTGPGVGVSRTALVRVAEPDALDEVTTLIGFPIEREREPLLSQRMIILLTEELLEEAEREGALDDATFRERSERIAEEQDRLRERVEEAMFVRAGEAEEDPEAQAVAPPAPDPDAPPVLELPEHDHDGNPIMAVNQDLVAAFNAMWEASRLLRQAEPRASLPPQYEALERLQAVREGERVFARGRVTRPPLDLDAARGTGEVDEAAPVERSSGEAVPDGARWRGEIEAAARSLDDPPGGRAAPLGGADTPRPDEPASSRALLLQDLAAAILAAPDGSVSAAAAVERAARAAASGGVSDARRMLSEAASALMPEVAAGAAPPLAAPTDRLGAEYIGAGAGAGEGEAGAPGEASAGVENGVRSDPARGAGPPAGSAPEPFVFATARYASGDWDSAPLVPSNLAHSLAQYTDLPVDEEGVVVDLASPELLRYPFVFLTGHLPVRLDERESEGLRRYVERGGFVFVDDHNHDVDGGFHRSVLAELARVFGPDALQPLPADHELYRSFFVFDDGPPITGHELSGWGDGLIHRELFAVTLRGRIGVLYSNKDYASEWSYHAENKRFLAQDNTRFGVNVILYALTR